MLESGMRESVLSLLAAAFDYAGLFPPAQLRIQEAGVLYGEHQQGEESWLMDRFICPANRLNELGRFLSEFNTEQAEPWELAVVGTTLDSEPEDATLIEQFEAEYGRWAVASTYEAKCSEIPALSVLKTLAQREYECFLELPWHDSMTDIASAIAEVEGVGIKARTGGTSPELFPSTENLAKFLKLAVDLELRFKLTAGLHSPLRHVDPKLGPMHGFLNCLIGACASWTYDLSTSEVVQILELDHVEAFVFSETEVDVADMDVSMDVDDILNFRSVLGGIGSCSITEPFEGLCGKGLGAAKILP